MDEGGDILAWAHAHPAAFDRAATALGYELADDRPQLDEDEAWRISDALWGVDPARPRRLPTLIPTA